jgi:hypothetical protein
MATTIIQSSPNRGAAWYWRIFEMWPERTAEPRMPSNDLEIGLPRDEYSGESRILWEQSVHVDLTGEAHLHATGPGSTANGVSVCIESDWRMALMFRRGTARLRYQGREVMAYAVHKFEPEDGNVHLRRVFAVELRFFAKDNAEIL